MKRHLVLIGMMFLSFCSISNASQRLVLGELFSNTSGGGG